MARLKDSEKVDQATRDRLTRMMGAHEVSPSYPDPSMVVTHAAIQNGMENLPLWIGAVVSTLAQ